MNSYFGRLLVYYCLKSHIYKFFWEELLCIVLKTTLRNILKALCLHLSISGMLVLLDKLNSTAPAWVTMCFTQSCMFMWVECINWCMCCLVLICLFFSWQHFCEVLHAVINMLGIAVYCSPVNCWCQILNWI